MKTTLIIFWSIIYLAWSISSLIEIYKVMILNGADVIDVSNRTWSWIYITIGVFIAYSVHAIILDN